MCAVLASGRPPQLAGERFQAAASPHLAVGLSTASEAALRHCAAADWAALATARMTKGGGDLECPGG
jgi:hypothetical protein